MPKKYRFRGPFDKQHGKGAQALLKSTSHHLYHIHWSLPRQLIWRKSLLLKCQILGLLVNTLAADEKYPVLNRDNLTIPIQMQLSQKQKTFSEFLCPFFKSIRNFKYFQKKKILIDYVFPKLQTPKTSSYKCLKSPFWKDFLTSNMVNVLNHFWNLHHSTFIILIDHCQVNWVGKSLCFWNAKSSDCLLTHWLPMKSILFLIEKI